MAKRARMQRVVLGVLAIMLVSSLVLAVMAFVMPATASAQIKRRVICSGWACEEYNPCIIIDQKTHHCCANLCEHPVGGLYCATGWFCCTENTCNSGG